MNKETGKDLTSQYIIRSLLKILLLVTIVDTQEECHYSTQNHATQWQMATLESGSGNVLSTLKIIRNKEEYI